MARIREIFDAESGSASADELEILTTLVAQFEQRSVQAPSPIDAIRFRMDQTGLSNRDLEPLIGSRARVSEVLAGNRSLTIDMMRALNEHLGIPAQSLLGSKVAAVKSSPVPSVKALAELVATGLMKADEQFAAFIDRALSGRQHRGLSAAHLRNTRTDRTNAKTDTAALQGWCAAILLKSRQLSVTKGRGKRTYGHEMARDIARLSAAPDGIQRVTGYLADRGISLVILKHFTGTFLDGAAMLRDDGVHVIALTLRYDRIDNFWFTLLHEFAHVACHLSKDTPMIFDDLEISSSAVIEDEADKFAQQALIPDEVWRLVGPDLTMSGVVAVASKAGVHPAIVAGRWQREYKDYRRFARMVGHGEVRSVLA